jgi:CRISPR system Cascade subunit CasC
MWWREHNEALVGHRTKRLQGLLFDAIEGNDSPLQQGQDEELLKEGIRVFTDAYYASADKKKPEKTNVLVFIGPEEVDVCAQAIRDLWQDRDGKAKKGEKPAERAEGIASIVAKRRKPDAKKKAKKDKASAAEPGESGTEEAEEEKNAKVPSLKLNEDVAQRIREARVSADIALFGRMLAEQPERNTEAACQVAHPISTHKVDMEMDYFTAVDDLNPQEETGAEMLGEVGFNSACFYRYAVVDRDQLARNLARKTEREKGKWKQELEAKDYEEADKVIKAFLEAIVYAIPTGKQNSFAAQNLPSFGLFVRRQSGVPISLANAFAKPVRPTRENDDLIGLSVSRLTEHWDALKRTYGEQGANKTTCFTVEVGDEFLHGLKDAKKTSVEDAVAAVTSE